MSSRDGKAFESRSEQHMKQLMPYEGELLFAGDTACCLVTGYSTAGPTAVLGTTKAPYTDWTWKKLDQPIRSARFLRQPGKRVVAVVWMHDRKPRTALCEFDAARGRFTELLELATAEEAASAGLAWHDGHVWVSHAVADGDRVHVHLAKVRIE